MTDEHTDCTVLGWLTEKLVWQMNTQTVLSWGWLTETPVWQMNTDCSVVGLAYRNAGMTDEHRLYCRGADLQKRRYDRWTQTVLSWGRLTEKLVWQMNTDCSVVGLAYRNAGMTDERRLYCRGAGLQKSWYDRWTQTVVSWGWLTETPVWQMNADCIVVGQAYRKAGMTD